MYISESDIKTCFDKLGLFQKWNLVTVMRDYIAHMMCQYFRRWTKYCQTGQSIKNKINRWLKQTAPRIADQEKDQAFETFLLSIVSRESYQFYVYYTKSVDDFKAIKWLCEYTKLSPEQLTSNMSKFNCKYGMKTESLPISFRLSIYKIFDSYLLFTFGLAIYYIDFRVRTEQLSFNKFIYQSTMEYIFKTSIPHTGKGTTSSESLLENILHSEVDEGPYEGSSVNFTHIHEGNQSKALTYIDNARMKTQQLYAQIKNSFKNHSRQVQNNADYAALYGGYQNKSIYKHGWCRFIVCLDLIVDQNKEEKSVSDSLSIPSTCKVTYPLLYIEI